MAILPAGMRNNNPGNIKYIGQPGTKPSVNTDQGDPQAVYATPQEGMRAMYELLLRKYSGGKVTPRMIIAGQGGWTPGNEQAAANIAASAGIGLDDNINLTDPANATRFMRALMLQEHGQASLAYDDTMINAAIGGGDGATADAARTNVPSAAFPYRLYGGATREDAITGLNPAFSEALVQLYNAAPPEVQRELGLNSAYRSEEVQRQLWEKSDKSGKMVAAPGKSRHQHGEAADLYGFGLTKDAVSQATRDWVNQNVANYGLTFPMDYEPWHIQLARSQGAVGPGRPPGPAATNAPAGPVEAAGGGAGSEATDVVPSFPAAAPAAKKQNWWEMFGEGIAEGAGAMGGGKGFDYSVPAQPGPARVDVGVAPIIDPARAEAQRQMLALAMQRLNAGTLWG
jgi:hypothetical protein